MEITQNNAQDVFLTYEILQNKLSRELCFTGENVPSKFNIISSLEKIIRYLKVYSVGPER